ncbi:MAG: peptidoglycan-binding protein [Pseudomonadota bacterium]
MDLRLAILSAAPDAPDPAVQGMLEAKDRLDKLGDRAATVRRIGHLIGQCAHESLHFSHESENLFYTTAARIRAVWPSRFSSNKSAEPFTRNPAKLANKVYGGRMGNTGAGDGFKYRGRGYIQLTGRSNYETYGKMIGVDLVVDPDRAIEPDIAWLLAAAFMNTTERKRKTLFTWADLNNIEQVTRGINGGINGLADRRALTLRALEALGDIEKHPLLEHGSEGPSVVLLQRILAKAGFSPGGQDGQFGGKTEAALKAFQMARGLDPNGTTDAPTWAALDAASGRPVAAEPGQQKPADPPPPSDLAPGQAPSPNPRPAAQSTAAPAQAPAPAPRPQPAAADAPPTLRPGDTGEDVAALQRCLADHGFAIVSRFGPSTEEAVRSFQAAQGLLVDGVAGPKTWKKLLAQGGGS